MDAWGRARHVQCSGERKRESPHLPCSNYGARGPRSLLGTGAMGTPRATRQQPLGTDVLHDGIPAACGRLLHLLHQGGGPGVLLLHGDQVSRAQFAARQVGLDLGQRDKAKQRESSVKSIQPTHASRSEHSGGPDLMSQ